MTITERMLYTVARYILASNRSLVGLGARHALIVMVRCLDAKIKEEEVGEADTTVLSDELANHSPLDRYLEYKSSIDKVFPVYLDPR